MVDLAAATPSGKDAAVRLRRALTLPLAVLFGLGVTVGAGIYVLIGAAAGRAGFHAPIAFALAALVMAPTAASFAELAGRMPVSAGEAAFVNAGFRKQWLARVVGLMVIVTGIVSAAAISRGSAGYIRELVPAPEATVVVAVVLAMGAMAAWGILQSAALAGLMTLIELVGLLVIIVAGLRTAPEMVHRLPEIWTGLGAATAWHGILSASLLAFFAFIGFECLSNIAEEVHEPSRTLPIAIFLTLILSTALYILVIWVALVSVPHAELASSQAPLSLVFQRVAGASPALISAIAIVATVNGVIAQMVMASRVVYGMADQGLLPAALARVAPRTRTPLRATALVVALVVVLATSFPLETLATTTSRLTLAVFALVNASLVLLKLREPADAAPGFRVSLWVPAVGCLLCIGLLAASLTS